MVLACWIGLPTASSLVCCGGSACQPVALSNQQEGQGRLQPRTSAAMVMNACSTLLADLAEVSMYGMPISSANALAVAKSTTRLDVKSVCQAGRRGPGVRHVIGRQQAERERFPRPEGY